MSVLEMDMRYTRGSPAESVPFAPRIINLALFGTIAQRPATVSIAEGTIKQPVKLKISHVQQLFPDIPKCFEFNASRVIMSSVGVFCTETLTKGSILGPYSGRTVTLEEAEKCSNSFKEGLWEIYRDGKIKCYIDASDPVHKNWMYFIQSARNDEEQTLAAMQYGEVLYFKALRDIKAGEELLVWYDKKQYELYMGLPTAFHQMVPLLKKIEASPASGDEEDDDDMDDLSVGSEEMLLDVEEDHETEKNEDDEEPTDLDCQMEDEEPQCIKHVYCQKPIIYSSIPTTLQQQHINNQSNPNSGLVALYPFHHVHNGQWLKQTRVQPIPGSPQQYVVPHPAVTGINSPMVPIKWSSTPACLAPLPSPTIVTQPSSIDGMFIRLPDGTRWQCRLCNRIFTSQGSLRAHARIHNNEKPYQCKFCQRTFTQASTLRSHERLHTGEKPYKCDACGKAFTQSAGLRSHKKTHTPH